MGNLVGQSLGRYHILEQLGEGGMAVVYKALDTKLDRYVAVKVILPSKGHSDKFLKRFEREAKALAGLSHPNIVGVIDYGENHGLPYLVMEYISGGTLKQKFTGKPFSWKESVKISTPIANALSYAHQHKIIHRDIKPSNILITETGSPMLSDFGIAKIVESEETMDITGTGVGIGTPEYMSPEQAQGKIIDARSDVYSLGIVLFEMVTGRKPYQADTPYAVVIKQVNEPVPNPRAFRKDLPLDVEKVLLKALAKNPANRFQSMKEFEDAMDKGSEIKKSTRLPKLPKFATATILVGVLIYLLFLVTRWVPEINNPKSLPVITKTQVPVFVSTSTHLIHETSETPTATKKIVLETPEEENTVPLIIRTPQLVEPEIQDFIYDSFDDTKYNGTYNTTLWNIFYGTLPKPLQMNGYLTFSDGNKKSTQGHEIALQAKSIGVSNLSQIKFIQADLALGNDTNKYFSHIAINVVVPVTSKGQFWIEADLINSKDHPVLLCKIGYFGSKDITEYEQYYGTGLSYGQFNRIQLNLNQAEDKIQWFINDKMVYEFTSKEYGTNIDKPVTVIVNSNRDTNSITTTFIDNFIIGK